MTIKQLFASKATETNLRESCENANESRYAPKLLLGVDTLLGHRAVQYMRWHMQMCTRVHSPVRLPITKCKDSPEYQVILL